MESVREKNRTIHVFVSSTFRDLNDERDYLVKIVFPELIRKARGRSVYVTFIDLRWGITEDSLSKIISICLKEIDRAKYFIGILGNTYGTVLDNDKIEDLANVPDNLKEKWIKEGYSLTHIEMDYAVFTKSEIAEHLYFYFKAKEASNSNVNQQDAEKLEKLKNKIRNPNSKWHWSKHEFRSSEELGEQIKNDFMNMLDTLYPQESAPSPLEILRSIHSQYSSFLLTNYVEDREKVNEILSALEKEKKVLVTGEVGIGKSSMLAFIKREYEKKNPNALIIEHYIGAGGNETSKDIALHILAEIKDKLKKLKIPFEEKTESDENEIYKEISKLISYIPDWNNSLIIIDAIDQLPNFQEIKFLNFLPEIKILVSCRDGTSTMEHMKSFNYKIITLRQLDKEKIKEIIKNELKEMGKELTDQQINRIAAFKASSNPLYLKTLIDQLSKIGELKKSTETQTQFMDRMIDKHLKPNLEDLYDLMIENLKEILKQYFNNEGALIQFLKLIAVSRSGLSLQEIISMTNIKPAEFAVIRNYLDYHLAEKNGLVDFFHASLKETVFKKYIYNKDLEKETRKIISDWFLKQETDKRQIYELPYQLLALGDKSNLKEYLKKFEVFKLFTEEPDTAQYFEFITYLRSSFDNLCKEMVQTYQPQILSLPEDQSSLYLNSLGLLCLNTACYNEAIDSFEKSLEIYKKYFGNEHPDVAGVLSNLGLVYAYQGKFADAEKMYKQALEILKKHFGNEHPTVAGTLSNLGLVYFSQGKFADAEKMYKQALAISKKYFGDEHPDVARDLNNLGLVYAYQGKFADAEKMYKQVLEILKKYYGDEHPDVAKVLNNLGNVYFSQGKFADAEKMYKQALEIYKKHYGDNHPNVAMVLNSLGNVYKDQGKYAAAEKMYKQALEIYKKHFGDEHPTVADVLNSLGNVYKDQGKFADAEKMLKQALEILKKHFGDEHPDVARDLNNLGLVYAYQGKFADAENVFKQVLEILKKYYGDEHPSIANVLYNLGLVYAYQGKFADAEKMYKQALEIYKKYFGDEHPTVADVLNNLGNVYAYQGKYDDAEKVLKQALEIYKKHYGDNHPNVAMVLNNLGLVYYNQGKYDDAEKVLKQALEIYKKHYGDEDLRIATVLDILGVVYAKQGRYADAENVFKQALEILKKHFGDNHPDVAKVLINLGLVYKDQGKYDDAEKVLKQALEILKKHFGDEHPIVADVLDILGDVYAKQGRAADAENAFKQAREIRRKLSEGGAS